MKKPTFKSKHYFYYAILGAIMLVGIFLTSSFGYSRQLQLITIILTAFLYVSLGILHHLRDHSISIKIVLEYVAIATLGISLAYFMITIYL